MALSPPKVIDLDDPLNPRPETTTTSATAAKKAPPTAAAPAKQTRGSASKPVRRPPAAAQTPKSEGGQGGDPYAGSPKVTVSMRATKQLWDGLGALTRRLEDEGLRSSRTELTEALWHFHAPESVEDARELVRRYRHARLG